MVETISNHNLMDAIIKDLHVIATHRIIPVPHVKMDESGLKQEIDKGAAVQLKYERINYYDKWRPNGRPTCCSSHFSTRPQFRVSNGPGSVLIGSNEHGTWFQFERCKPCCFACHYYDWCQYKITGKNQGPSGQSAYILKTPIIMEMNRLQQGI
jgi:hypothetical protein